MLTELQQLLQWRFLLNQRCLQISANQCTDRGDRSSRHLQSLTSHCKATWHERDHDGKILLRRATLSFTLPPGFRNFPRRKAHHHKADCHRRTSAFPSISTPRASLNELILIKGVLPIFHRLPLPRTIYSIHTYQPSHSRKHFVASQFYWPWLILCCQTLPLACLIINGQRGGRY